MQLKTNQAINVKTITFSLLKQKLLLSEIQFNCIVSHNHLSQYPTNLHFLYLVPVSPTPTNKIDAINGGV